MNQTLKKLLTTLVLLLVIFGSIAGPGSGIAYAAKQNQTGLEVPLAPGFSWNNIGTTTRSITLNVKGDTLSLSGVTYQAVERFGAQLPKELVDFYSNEQLFNNGGWTSDNTFETPDGQHQVFYHESGVYLAVDFITCADDANATCVTVWESEPATGAAIIAAPAPHGTSQNPTTPDATTFSKTSPTNGSSVSTATSVTLTWASYYPAPDKYSYCIKEGSTCANNDPNWTSRTTTSVTVTNLVGGKKYYWQVRAVTCVTCTPKTFVYANSGVWWTFNTPNNIISGNAGVAGAILNYSDNGTKAVTSDASGNYNFTPTYNWSGTVTPSKIGYSFSPVSRAYSNVKTAQVNQNYVATIFTYTISGNVGTTGVKLSYTDGVVKTVTVDGSGNYVITVPYGWSGTIIPWKTGTGFTPSSLSYTNVTTSQIQNYTFADCTTIDASIGGSLNGTYCLAPGHGTRQSYNLNTGPVILSSSDGLLPFIASEQLGWKVNGIVTSYGEMMGLPASELTNDYFFPWYNNVTLNTELRVGNVGSAGTTITVKIAGALVETFSLAQNTTVRKNYAGYNNGPMEVSSSGGVNIIASERFAWKMSNGVYSSVTEMMGLPAAQLSDTYVFSWYNNQTLDTQLRVGNVGASDTNITVKIAGITVDTFTLAQNATARKNYVGYNNGPMEVTATSGAQIIASERVSWKVNGGYTSYGEMMGLPGGQLTDTYIFPNYDNLTMKTELRIGNVGTSGTTINISIGGIPVENFTLAQNTSVRRSYPLNDGPVVVSSSGGVSIITSQRFAWISNGVYSSVTEMLGLPNSLSTNAVVFPWYNNVTMDTKLRFERP